MITIERIEKTEKYTKGVIRNSAVPAGFDFCRNPDPGVQVCYCLEEGWNENRPNYSCIPDGIYWAKRRIYHPKKGKPFESFLLLDVVGRFGIWFHPGNTVLDTEGCILPGMRFGMLKGLPAVLNSKVAFNIFMNLHKGTDLIMVEFYTV